MGFPVQQNDQEKGLERDFILELDLKMLNLSFAAIIPSTAKPSPFERISTDFELANLRIRSETIDTDCYGVDVDGNGQFQCGWFELSYDGTAKITTRQEFLTKTFARFAGANVENGLLSFLFNVGGTIEEPSFSKNAVHRSGS